MFAIVNQDAHSPQERRERGTTTGLFNIFLGMNGVIYYGVVYHTIIMRVDGEGNK